MHRDMKLVNYLISYCKYMVVEWVEEIATGQTLLRMTTYRILWGSVITHALAHVRRYSCSEFNENHCMTRSGNRNWKESKFHRPFPILQTLPLHILSFNTSITFWTINAFITRKQQKKAFRDLFSYTDPVLLKQGIKRIVTL